MYDFDKVVLSINEKFKLYATKVKGKSTAEFLGESLEHFLDIAFVQRNFSDKTDRYGNQLFDDTYSVTSNYERFLTYERNKVFFGILKSFVTPIIVSVITSIVTVLVLKLLGIG